MKLLTHHYKRIRSTFIITSLSVFVLGLFLLPNFTTYSSEGKNLFTIWILGEDMGTVDSVEKADELITRAREELASGQDNLYMIENIHKEIVGEEAIYKSVDDEEEVYKKIKKTLKDHQKETMTRAYMVKVNNTTVNLASAYGLDPQGIIDISFAEEVEVVETYIPKSEIVDVDTALSLLTGMQEVQQIYEVQPGDTLSAISRKVGITMEELVELNSEYIKDVNSTIRAGQALIITVPEPELSVLWTRREIVEESYEADIIYIDNDDWYTTKQVTLTEPSAGFRKVVSDVTYKNDNAINKNIVKEEILLEAIAKVVERGTKVPPTYIKPISGGSVSSGFGRRSSPGGIGSRNHQGVDFAIPSGSTVVASSGGTVSAAGWSGGYGYMVLITHPDGSQTRYAHLSKVLVSAGQSVSQGQKIALSGNTGISTGPHLHFEIILNGTPVNPLNYIN